MFGYVTLAIIAFFFIFIPEATFILFGGLLIALILMGLASTLKKLVPASKALALVITVAFLILGGVGISWLVSSQIIEELEVFTRQFPAALKDVMQTLEENAWYNKLMNEADEGNWVENFIAPKILPKTAKLATVSLNAATAFGLAMLLGFYMAIDSPRYLSFFKKLVPRNKVELYESFFLSLKENLQSWLLAKLLSMLAVGALSYFGLLLLGIKAAFPLALIATFFGFVPNVGPILAALPAITIAFAQGWEYSIYVAILYMAVQAAEGVLITPLLQKKKVKILPAGMIIFQFIMAILFGFGGLFMATPILVALMVGVQKFWVESPSR